MEVQMINKIKPKDASLRDGVSPETFTQNIIYDKKNETTKCPKYNKRVVLTKEKETKTTKSTKRCKRVVCESDYSSASFSSLSSIKTSKEPPRKASEKTPQAKRKPSVVSRKRNLVSQDSTKSSLSTKYNKKGSDDSSSDSTNDEDAPLKTVVSSRMAQRDSKQKLIAKVLCRWWYALDPWPPQNFDYDSELARRRYKVVPLDEWEAEDDVDSNGFTKVYPIPFYLGVYRDPKGNAIDIRPFKGKPCYVFMKSLSELKLTQLLEKALSNQLAKIDSSAYANTERDTLDRLKNELKTELAEVQVKLARMNKETCDAIKTAPD